MKRTLTLLWSYKHYWIWPILLAFGLFLLIVLAGNDSSPTPYIYNIN